MEAPEASSPKRARTAPKPAAPKPAKAQTSLPAMAAAARPRAPKIAAPLFSGPLAPVAALLAGPGGAIPRRAALAPDGRSVLDCNEHPEAQEHRVLSELCQLAHAAAPGGHAPPPPLDTTELLTLALAGRRPGPAWKAARDDIVQGHMDMRAAAAYVGCNPAVPAAFVERLVEARTLEQLCDVCAVMFGLLAHLPPRVTRQVAEAAVARLGALVDTLYAQTAYLPARERTRLLDMVGQLLGLAVPPGEGDGTGVHEGMVADQLQRVLAKMDGSMLCLFMHVSPRVITARDGLLDSLLEYAGGSPPRLALLARVQPGVLAPHVDAVCKALLASMPADPAAEVDPATYAALCALTQAVSAHLIPVATIRVLLARLAGMARGGGAQVAPPTPLDAASVPETPEDGAGP